MDISKWELKYKVHRNKKLQKQLDEIDWSVEVIYVNNKYLIKRNTFKFVEKLDSLKNATDKKRKPYLDFYDSQFKSNSEWIECKDRYYVNTLVNGGEGWSFKEWELIEANDSTLDINPSFLSNKNHKIDLTNSNCTILKNKISDLLNQIENGELAIPAFQREYVWTNDQVSKLIVSILRNYPIGQALFWHTNNLYDTINISENNQKKNIEGNKYVIDGQQRLTSLFLILKSCKSTFYKINKSFNLKEILFYPKYISIVDNEVKWVHDLFIQTGSNKERGGINIDDFKKSDIFKNFEHHIMNYTLAYEQVKTDSLSIVTKIFEILNTTSSKLNTYQILHAKTFEHTNEKNATFDLDKLLKTSFKDETNYFNDQYFSYANLVINLCTLIKFDFEQSDKNTRKLTREDLKELLITNKILFDKAFKETKKFFNDQLYLDEIKKFPNINMFKILFVLLYKKPNFLSNGKTVDLFLKYINRSILFNHFDKGTTLTLKNDINFFMKETQTKNDVELKSLFSQEITEEYLEKNMSYNKKHGIVLLYNILLFKRGLSLWMNNNILLTHDKYSDLTKIELHHIFPKKSETVLKLNKDLKKYVDSIFNIAPIGSIENKGFSSKDPSVYLKENNLIYNENFEKCFISKEIFDKLSKNSFSKFIELRKKEILIKLNDSI